MSRSPVTVARLHRIYTDFPILPESNNSGHPMRKVLLRIVYPVRAGDVNGFGCILLTARLLSGILFSGHHHRPRLSLSDDLPSTVVPTIQVSQCPNPLLSFLQKISVTTVAILYPTQKQLSQLSQLSQWRHWRQVSQRRHWRQVSQRRQVSDDVTCLRAPLRPYPGRHRIPFV